MISLTLKAYFACLSSIKANNTCNEWWSKNFSKLFSPYISSAAYVLHIHQNILTLVMPFLGICSIFLSIFTFFSVNVSIAIISFFGLLVNIFDTSDGELARYKNQSSLYGQYLDKVSHYVANPSILISYGIIFLRHSHSVTSLLSLICFLSVIFDVCDLSVKDCLYILNDKNLTKTSTSLIKRSSSPFTSFVQLLIRIFFLNTSLPHIMFILSISMLDYLYLPYMLIYLVFCVFRISVRSLSIFSRSK